MSIRQQGRERERERERKASKRLWQPHCKRLLHPPQAGDVKSQAKVKKVWGGGDREGRRRSRDRKEEKDRAQKQTHTKKRLG